MRRIAEKRWKVGAALAAVPAMNRIKLSNAKIAAIVAHLAELNK